MAGPLSSVGCESGFALQSILEPSRRDATCFSRRQGKPYATAAWPAAEAFDVVSLVGHQLLPALLDPTSPEAVGEPYSRDGVSRRRCIAYTRRRQGFVLPRSSSLARGRRDATGASATRPAPPPRPGRPPPPPPLPRPRSPGRHWR